MGLGVKGSGTVPGHITDWEVDEGVKVLQWTERGVVVAHLEIWHY